MTTSAARDRILEVATDLFYKQGYRATGINEVIKKSGVAKATFYSHFPTKDELCKVYLKRAGENELLFIDQHIASAKGTVNRFLAVVRSLDPWLNNTEFRGCAFLHMVSEVPDASSPLRKEGKVLYDGMRKRTDMLAKELIESDSDKYGHLDVRQLSNDYMLVLTGAIGQAEIYNEIWPVKQAVKTLQRLIGK